jgi:hypothetical protein
VRFRERSTCACQEMRGANTHSHTLSHTHYFRETHTLRSLHNTIHSHTHSLTHTLSHHAYTRVHTHWSRHENKRLLERPPVITKSLMVFGSTPVNSGTNSFKTILMMESEKRECVGVDMCGGYAKQWQPNRERESVCGTRKTTFQWESN